MFTLCRKSVRIGKLSATGYYVSRELYTHFNGTMPIAEPSTTAAAAAAAAASAGEYVCMRPCVQLLCLHAPVIHLAAQD